MSNDSNPYGGTGGGYATTVQYGGQPARHAAGSRDEWAGGRRGHGELIKDTTTAGFPTDVIRESRQQPVLVDFWAPWCGPCKQLTPALEKAVRAAGGKVKLVKMNIDDHPSIAGQLGIQSIPAVIAFKNGQPVDGFMGAIPESQIREFLDKVVGKGAGAEIAEALAAAAEARAAGDTQTAADIYSAVLEQAPDNADAAAGLADLLFESGDAETARAVLGRVPADKQDAPAVAAVRAKMKLAEEAAALGNPAEFEARLAKDPKRPSGALRSRRDPERARQARAKRRTICSPSSRPTAPGTTTPRGSSCCSSSRPGVRPTRRRWRAAASCRRSCSRDAEAAIDPSALAVGTRLPHIDTMPGGSGPRRRALQAGNANYRVASDLPATIPVFPLSAALLLPGGRMPLNIFEPRYIQMIDEALGGNARDRHDPAGARRRHARGWRAGTLRGRLRRPADLLRRDLATAAT